jgi:hypothetical protein
MSNHAYVSDVGKVAKKVLEHVQPTLDENKTKIEDEIIALKEELAQNKKEFGQLKKDMHKFRAYIDAMQPVLTRFGEYTFLDGRKAIGIITKAFPVAGTIDIIAFDNGGSGGVYELEGKTVGVGKEKFQPFLSYDPEEEEEDGTGSDAASSEEADADLAT